MMKARIRKRQAVQQRIEFSTHGGRRRGAGRKRRGGRRRVAHRKRPELDGRTPVHVTLRVAADVPYLRNHERCAVLRTAFCKAKDDEFRVVEFDVQGNHIHLICEARSSSALARGVQKFEQRVTRALNDLLDHEGTVWADRYHSEPLRSPRQVRAALRYVLLNARRHGIAPRGRPDWIDPFSSGRYFTGWSRGPREGPAQRDDHAPVAPAETWVLSVGWRRHGLIDPADVPAAARR
jgi:REP element-mobilizing transposase RayT